MVGIYLRTQPPRRELHVSDRLLPQLLSWQMPHYSTQLTIIQPVSYTILVTTKNCYLKIYPDVYISTFETKNGGIFFNKKCQSPNLPTKLRLSSGVMSLTAPKKKIKDRLDASPGDGNSWTWVSLKRSKHWDLC